MDSLETVRLFSLVATKAELKHVANLQRSAAYAAAFEAYQVAHLDSEKQLQAARTRYAERADSIRRIYTAAVLRSDMAHKAAYRLADKLPEA